MPCPFEYATSHHLYPIINTPLFREAFYFVRGPLDPLVPWFKLFSFNFKKLEVNKAYERGRATLTASV